MMRQELIKKLLVTKHYFTFLVGLELYVPVAAFRKDQHHYHHTSRRMPIAGHSRPEARPTGRSYAIRTARYFRNDIFATKHRLYTLDVFFVKIIISFLN